MHPEASSSSGKDHHLTTGTKRDHPSTCSPVFAPYAPSVPSEGSPLEDVVRAAEIAEGAVLEEEIMAAEEDGLPAAADPSTLEAILDTEDAEVAEVAKAAEVAEAALVQDVVAEDPVVEAAGGHRVGPH